MPRLARAGALPFYCRLFLPRAVLLLQFATMRHETKKLLDNAVAAHELKACDTGELS